MRAKLPKVMSGRMWCRGSKNIGEEWMPNRMVCKTSNKPSNIFKLDIKYQNKNIHRKKRHWGCQNVLSHGRKRTNHSSCRKSTHDHAPQYRTRVGDMRNILFFYNAYLKRDMHIFICFSNEIDRWLVSMRNWVQKLHLCAVSLRLFNDFPTFRHFFNTEANNSGNRTCKKYSRPKTRENLSTKTGQWRSCKWNCPFIVSSHELSWTCGFYKRTPGKLNWNYVNFVFRLCISYFSR